MEILYMNVDCLKDEKLFQNKLESLSRERQKKILSHRFEEDQRLSLGAGILLDEGLKKRGYRERELVCEYNKQGKPFYPELSDFYFNLTHSGKYAAAVFGEAPLGIDIEKMREDRKKISLAKRFFHPKEYEALEREDGTEQFRFFYQIWTLKESYVKAVGRGMNLPFSSFYVSPKENAFSMKSQELGRVKFYQYDMIPGYCLAVCAKEDKIPSLLYCNAVLE